MWGHVAGGHLCRDRGGDGDGRMVTYRNVDQVNV